MSRKLTLKEETRIRIAIRDRIMHFSPTISPAPKSVERKEIESIASAFSIFKEAGVSEVIIQPKYMGSYCDIYLHKNIEDSRFFSRRGYSIKESRVPHKTLVEAVRSLHERFEWNDVELRIVQAELLPWAALGRGLIDRDFGGYGSCHQDHCNYLKSSGLLEAISSQASSPEFKEFLADFTVLSTKELNDKYPQHVRRQYETMRWMYIPNSKSYQKAIDIYKEQLSIYGQDGDVEFKPFNLLKTVYDDGREDVNEDNIEGFRAVSDDEHLVCNLNDETPTDSGYSSKEEEQAYGLFNKLVSGKMEGIVIKPRVVWDKQIAPMFKVRNNNYLQMIYGIRFQDDYEYYFDRRKVGKKMRCSRNEWNIAQTMLRIPMSEINNDNEFYKELVTKRILEEDFEMTLDGRL